MKISEIAETEEEKAVWAILDQAVDQMKQAGIGAQTFRAHAFISHGLFQLSELCPHYLLDELQFVRGWIDERIEDTKKEMN